MQHPLFGKPFIFYCLVWVLIIIAHTSFLHYGLGFSPERSLVDAVVFNILLAGFGVVYWYVVKYLSPEKQGFVNLLISHFLGTAIGASFIVYITGFLLAIPSSEEGYSTFLRNAVFWRFVLSIFYLIMIIMLYYLLQYNFRMKKKIEDEANLQHMLRNAELDMLKFQLNPHFIFNSLNSISSLTLTDPGKAREMIIRLSDFLRTSLGKKQQEKHTLQAELNQMRLYLEIERVRFGDRLELKENIQEECLKLFLPNMILQPLYENAIKHGLYEMLETLTIETSVSCTPKSLNIAIKNNYDGHETNGNRKGIGLVNVENRLKLFYGAEGHLSVTKENGIFEVQLSIPRK